MAAHDRFELPRLLLFDIPFFSPLSFLVSRDKNKRDNAREVCRERKEKSVYFACYIERSEKIFNEELTASSFVLSFPSHGLFLLRRRVPYRRFREISRSRERKKQKREREREGGGERNFFGRLDEGDILNFKFVDMKKGENGSRENIAMLPWKFNVEFDDNNVLSCKLYSQLSFRCVRWANSFIHSFVHSFKTFKCIPPLNFLSFIIHS